MRYSTPELIELGPACALVKGIPIGKLDHGDPTVDERPDGGMALGLDD